MMNKNESSFGKAVATVWLPRGVSVGYAELFDFMPVV